MVLFFFFPVISIFTKDKLGHGPSVTCVCRANSLLASQVCRRRKNKPRKPCALSPSVQEETGPGKSKSLLRDSDTVSLQPGVKKCSCLAEIVQECGQPAAQLLNQFKIQLSNVSSDQPEKCYNVFKSGNCIILSF